MPRNRGPARRSPRPGEALLRPGPGLVLQGTVRNSPVPVAPLKDNMSAAC